MKSEVSSVQDGQFDERLFIEQVRLSLTGFAPEYEWSPELAELQGKDAKWHLLLYRSAGSTKADSQQEPREQLIETLEVADRLAMAGKFIAIKGLSLRGRNLILPPSFRFERCKIDGAIVQPNPTTQRVKLGTSALARFVEDVEFPNFPPNLDREAIAPIDCVVERIRFDHCTLQDLAAVGTLKHVSFFSCDLVEVDFRSTHLDQCYFSRGSWDRLLVDEGTRFERCRTEKTIVPRALLSRLDKGRGGLGLSNLMDMEITDPVAELRSSFSGFWSWLHLAALFAFFVPYAVFILGRLLGLGDHQSADVPLWSALARFVLTGGASHPSAITMAINLGTVLLLLAYNGARAVLLYKTKQLELEESITGLPARLPSGKWGRFIRCMREVARVGFVANVILIIAHTAMKLCVLVPGPGL